MKVRTKHHRGVVDRLRACTQPSLFSRDRSKPSTGRQKAQVELFEGCTWLSLTTHCVTVLPFVSTAQYLFATPNLNGLRARGLVHRHSFVQRPILTTHVIVKILKLKRLQGMGSPGTCGYTAMARSQALRKAGDGRGSLGEN